MNTDRNRTQNLKQHKLENQKKTFPIRLVRVTEKKNVTKTIEIQEEDAWDMYMS